MSAFFSMLSNVLIFVALAVPGFILAKTKLVTTKQSSSLSKVLIYVGVPFLIFNSTIKIDLNSNALTVILFSALISILYMFFWFFLTKPTTCFIKDFKTQGIARFSIFSSNNGFLGIPLATAVFTTAPLVVTSVVITNIVTNVVMYSLGIYLISCDKNTISVKKMLLNPCLIAFLLAIILNLLKICNYLPQIATYSNYLSAMVTPISMIIIGLKLGSIPILNIFKNKKTYYVALFKLIVVPTLLTAILLIVNEFLPMPNELILGLFVAFAMPTASMGTTFADNYNGDTQSAVCFTLGTTALSVITIPTLYYILTLLI